MIVRGVVIAQALDESCLGRHMAIQTPPQSLPQVPVNDTPRMTAVRNFSSHYIILHQDQEVKQENKISGNFNKTRFV